MSIIDKIGDFLGTSGYAKDKRLAREFLGVSLDRDIYETMRDNDQVGSLHQNFGTRARAYRNRKTPGERMQIDITKQVLKHMNKAGIVFDINDGQNATAVEILSRAVTFCAINDKQILKFGAPYDQDRQISARQERYQDQYPQAVEAHVA